MKPILFNAEMVKAILDGRKTSFRTTIKHNKKFIEEKKQEKKYLLGRHFEEGIDFLHPIFENSHESLLNKLNLDKDGIYSNVFFDSYGSELIGEIVSNYPFYRPQYKVDDILYVKETFVVVNGGQYIFKADDNKKKYESVDLNIKWNSAVHLTQSEARIFLKVTNVRVERLQDINWKDIFNEGFESIKPIEQYQSITLRKECKDWWINLWNSTAKDCYKWEDNPYVFVYEFERVQLGEAKK